MCFLLQTVRNGWFGCCVFLQAHVDKTGSEKGKSLLANWDASLAKFWQLVPPAEKNTPEVNPDVPASASVAAKVAVKA